MAPTASRPQHGPHDPNRGIIAVGASAEQGSGVRKADDGAFRAWREPGSQAPAWKRRSRNSVSARGELERVAYFLGVTGGGSISIALPG